MEGVLNFLKNNSYRKALVGIILVLSFMLNGIPSSMLTVSGSSLISGGVEVAEGDTEKLPKVVKMEISNGVFDYADLTWAYYGGIGEYFSERESIREGDIYYSGYQYSARARE